MTNFLMASLLDKEVHGGKGNVVLSMKLFKRCENSSCLTRLKLFKSRIINLFHETSKYARSRHNIRI